MASYSATNSTDALIFKHMLLLLIDKSQTLLFWMWPVIGEQKKQWLIVSWFDPVFFLSRWYFLLCVQEMSCFSVCCTCFILPQDQFVSTVIIICLFPVHLCKQHCLKHPTLVFPRLVVLSPENNHTHPTEGQMTILTGEGVLRGKSLKPYWNFQWCFFFLGGGRLGGEEGGCSELFQKLLHAGYGYSLEQHNTLKLCKGLYSYQSIWICLTYSEI